MALGLTQPLTEMSTRNISWGGKGGRCIGLTTLHLYVPTVLKFGSLILLEPSGPVQPCNGIALPMCCVSHCTDFNWGVIFLAIRMTVRPTMKTLKRDCWCLHICRSLSKKHHRNIGSH